MGMVRRMRIVKVMRMRMLKVMGMIMVKLLMILVLISQILEMEILLILIWDFDLAFDYSCLQKHSNP